MTITAKRWILEFMDGGNDEDRMTNDDGGANMRMMDARGAVFGRCGLSVSAHGGNRFVDSGMGPPLRVSAHAWRETPLDWLGS